MVRDAEDSRADGLLEFYTARAGVLLLPDPPPPSTAPPHGRPGEWQCHILGICSASRWATFRIAILLRSLSLLTGARMGPPIQTTYALQTPPACQVRPCAPQWRAHPHPSHLPGRQTRRCPPRPGEKGLQTLSRLSHLPVTDWRERLLVFHVDVSTCLALQLTLNTESRTLHTEPEQGRKQQK